MWLADVAVEAGQAATGSNVPAARGIEAPISRVTR